MPTPTDEQLKAFAEQLPPIYRDVLAAFPGINPERKTGGALMAMSLVDRFGPAIDDERNEYSDADHDEDEVLDALQQLEDRGFLARDPRLGTLSFAPTPLGERLNFTPHRASATAERRSASPATHLGVSHHALAIGFVSEVRTPRLPVALRRGSGRPHRAGVRRTRRGRCRTLAGSRGLPYGRDSRSALRDGILRSRHVTFFVTEAMLTVARGWCVLELVLTELLELNFRVPGGQLANVFLPLFLVPQASTDLPRSVWQLVRDRGRFHTAGHGDPVDWCVGRIRDFLRREQRLTRDTAARSKDDPAFAATLAATPGPCGSRDEVSPEAIAPS